MIDPEDIVPAPRRVSRLRGLLGDAAPRAAAIVAVAAASYLASHFEASADFYNAHLAGHLHFGRFQDMAPDLYWLGASNVLFGLVPLLALWLLREPFSEYGLGVGDARIGLTVAGLFVAAMLPLVLLSAHTGPFRGQYPLDPNAQRDWAHFCLFEALYVAYFAGWELFHRGFLLFGLRRRIGDLAILVQALPFALMHFAKPEPEAWGSFVAGVALGVLAVRARSLWYGFAVHGAIAFAMDLAQSWPHLHHP